MRTDQKGFTLIEILISIGVLVALATITAVSLGSFRENQALSNSVDDVISLLNKARSETLAADGGTNYGVHFDANDVVLFAGPAYVSGAAGNVVVTLDPSIELDSISLNGGGQDVVFDMLTGNTGDYGTLVVSRASTTLGERTLMVSEAGEVSSD